MDDHEIPKKQEATSIDLDSIENAELPPIPEWILPVDVEDVPNIHYAVTSTDTLPSTTEQPIEGVEIKELTFAAKSMLATMGQRHHIKKLKESLIDKGVMVAEAQKLTLVKDLNKPQTVTNSESKEIILPSTTIPKPITRGQRRKDRKLDKISARLQKDNIMSYSRAIEVANTARSNPQFKAGMPANLKNYGLLTPEEMARWRAIDTQGYGRGRRSNPDGSITPTKATIGIDKYEKGVTAKIEKQHKRLLALANDGEENPATQRRGEVNTGGKLARRVNRRIDRHARLARQYTERISELEERRL